MEGLLAESPDHTALLVAAARGFTHYAYGWVEPLGDDTEDASDSPRSRERSKRLYLRARDYGLRALATSIPGFQPRLVADPRSAVALARKRDVPALHWTANVHSTVASALSCFPTGSRISRTSSPSAIFDQISPFVSSTKYTVPRSTASSDVAT